MSRRYENFQLACDTSVDFLIQYGDIVDAGRWQGVSTAGKPDLQTKELMNLSFEVPVGGRLCPIAAGEYAAPADYDQLLDILVREIRPNVEWADEHFAERVGGKPLNPDPSHERWPHWRGQDSTTKNEEGKFTHTYSERFWPRWQRVQVEEGHFIDNVRPEGIRYLYGDLNDVVELLLREPYGRQAYLPIFFPEDTGAVHGGRIPCTLGYHFMLRRDQLHCWYTIRSCDAYRHFRDDLYLAVRLQLWVLEQLKERDVQPGKSRAVWDKVMPGNLYFTAFSFHVHMGELHMLLARDG